MSTSEQALSFGAAAEAYERARPSYPQEALGFVLPDGARRVLDLGAGTGKLTRLLVARGLEAVAVEPSPGMREQLARAVPQAQVLAGAGEAVPLPGASVDAVLVAQAWHWVDPVRAVPEVARVLRPGGRLGLVWNLEDEGVPWVAALRDLLRREHAVPFAMGEDSPVLGAPFGALERLDVRWSEASTPARVVENVASRSYVISLPDAARAAVLAQVAELLATHPDTAGRSHLAVPYVTTAWRADLVG